MSSLSIKDDDGVLHEFAKGISALEVVDIECLMQHAYLNKDGIGTNN